MTIYNLIMTMEQKTHTITYCKTRGCNKPIMTKEDKVGIIDGYCNECKRKKFNK